ncbi:MAG TPA: transporter substrate-binding domain-containing protein [Oligoflexus sp.]|uniref:substrate-binding periplasmic protein n=1 Tax=Oligoflexus sp. TaxID=1971216 RepID=UPI002D800133|nr:transporter substrate-binding domain-containing protein [Oligoflexus sp.]HET9236740.1 transporter substrate-binding domain-containing protein [Oligoflexus sp.]
MSRLFMMLIMLSGVATPLQAKELRISASAYLSEPYTIYEKGVLRAGLVKDIFDELGLELGVSIHYVDLPRKRVEAGLESGEIHIAPVAHPHWLSKDFTGDWTEPLFMMRELLVMQASSTLNYQGPGDLKGLRIGTILGYHYPYVEPYFRSGATFRADVQRADQSVDMLLNRRIDAYIVHDISFRYFQKMDKRAALLRAVDLKNTGTEISWAVSKKLPVPFERLQAFIRGLKKSGRIERILKKYQPAEAGPPPLPAGKRD